MQIDAREVVSGRRFRFDLCIIGAGAAGIAVAHEFASRNLGVCLLESGGLVPSAEVQDLYAGEIVGGDVADGYLTSTRLRYFGGTTNHWGGYCRPLDPVDFERKSWLSDDPGWPLGLEELAPYYDRAARLVEIEPFPAPGSPPEAFFANDTGLVSLPFHYSPPTRFAQLYGRDLLESPRVSVFLDANARELVPAADGGAIRHVEVVSTNRRRFRIEAKAYVLAAGGIENARILLASNSVLPAGVGNGRDLVGRYFMSHTPTFGYGQVSMSGANGPALSSTGFDPKIHAISIDQERKRSDQLLNACFILDPKYIGPDQSRVAAGPGSVYQTLCQFSFVMHRNRTCSLFPILVMAEQSANRESRITLGEERDFTGMPRVRILYRPNRSDAESQLRSIDIFRRALGRNSLGRVQTFFDDQHPPSLQPDGHHMGGTRIHDDPARGVVDRHCRVHGHPNLFVAGSSVFPSCGFANPTLTLVALAIRLSDHLGREVA